MIENWLAGPITTAAYGWRLQRADGVTLGFTSHDKDVVMGGLILRANPGMVPSSITESLGLEHDGLDLKAALTAGAINEDDLMAGRWDGARLEVFLFDWTDPGAPVRPLASGELGTVAFGSSGFTAELLGPTRILDKAVVPLTSPGCRAQFCDAACGLSRGRFSYRVRVMVDGVFVTSDEDWPVTPEQFAHGSLRWLEGKNCGLSSDIISASEDHFELASEPHFPVTAPILADLTEGCDKRLESCAMRYDNVINFRGEPYLPGNDLLTRFPGA